jgi:tRNA pseudouridine32 synthase/23S rRNA pseudouridine746 synthase
MRDGVSASRVAVGAGPWPRVLDFLQARMPTVADWPERLQRGEVLDAQGRPVPPDAPATLGTVVWYWRQPPPEPRLPFEVDVLHHDDHLVIADKPHFMSVTPGGQHLHETVLVRLKRQLGISTLVPMHRLDRETAGVMAFVVRPDERNAYQGLLREQRVHKVYEAVAPWRADVPLPQLYSSRLVAQEGDGFMQMLTEPGEPNAHTRIELIKRWEQTGTAAAAEADESAEARAGAGDQATQPLALAHYRLTPLTGRKHQLRVHLCALGLPIVGDRIYPRLWPHTPPGELPDFSQPLQLLARELLFTDPVTGENRHFRSRRTLQSVPIEPPDGGCSGAAGAG